MNLNLKISFVALVLSGTALCGSSDAMQDVLAGNQWNEGLVQPVKPLVHPATNNVPYDGSALASQQNLPPIVTAAERTQPPIVGNAVPPIIKTATMVKPVPPIVAAGPTNAAEAAPVVTTGKSQTAMPDSMLTPIKVTQSTPNVTKPSELNLPPIRTSSQMQAANTQSSRNQWAAKPSSELQSPLSQGLAANMPNQNAGGRALENQQTGETGRDNPASFANEVAMATAYSPSDDSMGSQSNVVHATMAPVDAGEDDQVQLATKSQVIVGSPQGTSPLSRGFSSAGVPLYASPQTNNGIKTPPVINGTPIRPRQSSAPMISAGSRNYAPGGGMTQSAPMYEQPMMQSGSAFGSNVEPMQSTYFDAPPMEAPVMQTVDPICPSCGGTGCPSCGAGPVSGCVSCGPNGCYDPNMVTDKYGICGSVTSARDYLIVDALYITRTDGNIALSNFTALTNFDEDLGWRITFGRKRDATQGRELSYLGTSAISQQESTVDAAGRLNALFSVSPFFNGAEATPFFNAVQQDQRKETQLHTIEFNRVRWGWDVIKNYLGLRFFYVDDQYSMFSVNNIGEQGTLGLETQNYMIGPQIGQELFYDVGYRISLSGFFKIGVYANYSEADAVASKEGIRFIDGFDSNTTISGSMEGAFIVHYQLSRRARLRLGYNALWLGEMTTVSDNIPSQLSPFTGAGTSDSDDMFWSAAFLGFEVYR